MAAPATSQEMTETDDEMTPGDGNEETTIMTTASNGIAAAAQGGIGGTVMMAGMSQSVENEVAALIVVKTDVNGVAIGIGGMIVIVGVEQGECGVGIYS